MRATRFLLIAIVALLGGSLAWVGIPARIRADDTERDSLESGTWAKPLVKVNPKYPAREADRGIEGWVDLSFVVSPEGTVEELIVDNSSGRKAFEEEALRAVRKWRYEPALLDGKPVEQCYTKVRITFSIPQKRLKRAARMRFKKEYAKATAFLEQGQLEEAKAKIDEIEREHVTTLYENARVWLLRSMVDEKEGDTYKQLGSLSRAVLWGTAPVEPGIEDISGSLDRIELRCDWHRVRAKPEKRRAWRIPAEWGDCSIYVFGEPGSTFRLLEFASTAS